MISYGETKAGRDDWNQRTYIKSATITWADEEWENELEVENEDGMDDKEFTEWIEENAEALAKEDAEKNGTTFEELVGIDYEENYIDDDAEYDTYCEFEWECATGR